LGHSDPLIRVAALLPARTDFLSRASASSRKALRDPVRAVRFEAASLPSAFRRSSSMPRSGKL
jgi:hypothetical protein